MSYLEDINYFAWLLFNKGDKELEAHAYEIFLELYLECLMTDDYTRLLEISGMSLQELWDMYEMAVHMNRGLL